LGSIFKMDESRMMSAFIDRHLFIRQRENGKNRARNAQQSLLMRSVGESRSSKHFFEQPKRQISQLLRKTCQQRLPLIQLSKKQVAARSLDTRDLNIWGTRELK